MLGFATVFAILHSTMGGDEFKLRPQRPLMNFLVNGEIPSSKTELRRQWEYLCASTEHSVTSSPWATFQALSLLYRDCKQYLSGTEFISRILAATIAGRRAASAKGEASPNGAAASASATHTRILDTPNPNIAEGVKTLREALFELSIHGVTKAEDDPFMDSLASWVAEALPFMRLRQKSSERLQATRNLFPKLLMALAVRSPYLVNFFSTTDIDVSTPQCASSIFQWCHDNDCWYPGKIKDKPVKQLTREQKFWDISHLVSKILKPFWADPSIYDCIFDGSLAALETIPLFRGTLVFTHSCGFIAELQKRLQVFGSMDPWFPAKPGKNSQHFLELCVASSERGSRRPLPSFTEVAALVSEELGEEIAEDAVCGFACKLIQLIATVFTGATLGRQRRTRSDVAGRKKFRFKKNKRGRPLVKKTIQKKQRSRRKA